ncbi:bifunctional DNA primase/polymerase [Streptomyces sp. NRRL S-350]|uniref:bifunctional DNA primase/polymerase n=1 Tax=Streptomyces sp. NRRL S-350 TaxID=1463902 RepID=UPI00068A40FC|nr:bifunctional DNA primase/polymerase [Streptomyces sp. NRRL S-350]
MSSELELAMRCAGRGWWVHPLLPGSKRPAGNCRRCRPPTPGGRPPCGFPDLGADGCGCLAAGRWCHGVRAATTDPELIRRWWGGRTFAVGVATGPSGLVVVDLDDHHHPLPERELVLPGIGLATVPEADGVRTGVDVLELLCRVRRAESLLHAPPTLTVRTPSGGVHLWYQAGGARFTQGAGRLGWQIDVRAGWSTAVAPTTRTPAGCYQLTGPRSEPARLPRWLALELARVGLRSRDPGADPPPARIRLPRPATRHRPHDAAAYAAAALRREAETVAGARSGRNDAINRAGFRLGQLVGAGLLEFDEVHRVLTEAAELAGVDPREAKAQSTLRRALQAGMCSPRTIPSPGARP